MNGMTVEKKQKKEPRVLDNFMLSDGEKVKPFCSANLKKKILGSYLSSNFDEQLQQKIKASDFAQTWKKKMLELW